MKFFKKIELKFIISGLILLAVIFFYFTITGNKEYDDEENLSTCEDCIKKKSDSYLGGGNNDIKKADESNYFVKIFSMLTSDIKGGENIIESDPVKDAAINQINTLSKSVCNDENLPEDIWISPKLIEKDAVSHVKELEKLIQYCKGLKSGKTTNEEKKEYYNIKIRLLEERKELVKYYIETLDGQIEDLNEKKIAEMEDRKAEDSITPEEEKINTEIETETNRFYEESANNTKKLIEQIDSAIRLYKAELAKL